MFDGSTRNSSFAPASQSPGPGSVGQAERQAERPRKTWPPRGWPCKLTALAALSLTSGSISHRAQVLIQSHGQALACLQAPRAGELNPGTRRGKAPGFQPSGRHAIRKAEAGRVRGQGAHRPHTSSGPTSVPPGTAAIPKPQFFHPQKHKWSPHTGPPEGHPSRYSWFPCVSGMAIGGSGLRGEILCDERHLGDSGLQLPRTSECGHEPWWEWMQEEPSASSWEDGPHLGACP